MPDWKRAVSQALESASLDPALESELVEELAQHLSDRYEQLRMEGLPESDCRRLVLAELRGAHLTGLRRNGSRPPAPPVGILPDSGGRLSRFRNDLKMAFRGISRRPMFSLTVILMLALALAGNAVFFSIFDSLFLRPLPFAHPDRLVDLDETAPQWNLQYVGISNPDLSAWKEQNSTFGSMAFFRAENYNLTAGNVTQRIQGAQVSRGMLAVLGLSPALGRKFTASEDNAGGASVAMLSYGLWQGTFGGDRDILGRVIKLDEQLYTVVGVLPPQAVFPDRTEVWLPLAADANINSGYYASGVGRLKHGVSAEQARSDLLRIHKAMVAGGHPVNAITSPVVTPLRERYLGNFKSAGRLLLGGVGLVLLMASLNIAALMAVRGAARSREVAIRAAMGASRGRIVAQLFTESCVLALAGGLLGVALGEVSLRLMIPLLADKLPGWTSFSLDWRFAAFCLVITGGAAVLFGLMPSVQAARVDLRATLQDSGVRSTGGRGRRNVYRFLIVCEVALALILATGAGLLVQALHKVLRVDPGFRAEQVITFTLAVPSARYADPEQRIEYNQKLLAGLQSLPEVAAAGITSSPPLSGHWGGVFEAEGEKLAPAGNQHPTVLQIAGSDGYFATMGMELLQGRLFDERDDEASAPLRVLVNQTFAQHFWGAENPVGKRIRRPGAPGSAGLFNSWYEVIGLLRDERHDGLDQPAPPTVFLAYSQALRLADSNDARSLREMTVVLRSHSTTSALVAPAHEIVHQLDPDVPMYAVQTMSEQVDRSLWQRRVCSWVLVGFALAALALAAAGVYGILSYVVAQATREIGIRLALGARPAQVLAQTVRSGMAPVALGIAGGLAAAFSAARLLESLLFGISARDPLTYALVALGVACMALLANLLPARRASHIDPLLALRSE